MYTAGTELTMVYIDYTNKGKVYRLSEWIVEDTHPDTSAYTVCKFVCASFFI